MPAYWNLSKFLNEITNRLHFIWRSFWYSFRWVDSRIRRFKSNVAVRRIAHARMFIRRPLSNEHLKTLSRNSNRCVSPLVSCVRVRGTHSRVLGSPHNFRHSGLLSLLITYKSCCVAAYFSLDPISTYFSKYSSGKMVIKFGGLGPHRENRGRIRQFSGDCHVLPTTIFDAKQTSLLMMPYLQLIGYSWTLEIHSIMNNIKYNSLEMFIRSGSVDVNVNAVHDAKHTHFRHYYGIVYRLVDTVILPKATKYSHYRSKWLAKHKFFTFVACLPANVWENKRWHLLHRCDLSQNGAIVYFSAPSSG